MKEAPIRVFLSGNGFSPSHLRQRTGLKISPVIEAGEIALVGRYKGKPSPYGMGYIVINKIDGTEMERYANQLLRHQKQLLANAVDEIVFDVFAPANKFNALSVSSSFAGKLKELNARLEFTNSDRITTLPTPDERQVAWNTLSSFGPNFKRHSRLAQKFLKAIEQDDLKTIGKLKEIL